MTASATPKLGVYAGFAAAAFLLGLVLGRPELAALGAPFAIFLVIGLTRASPPELAIGLELGAETTVENEELDGTLDVTARGPGAQVEVLVRLPSGIELASGEPRTLLYLGRGERETLPLRLRARRWGAYRLADVVVRADDDFGLLRFAGQVEARVPLRVYPRAERLRQLVAPLDTQPYAGNRVARAKGDGIEFADVRPFVPGDRVRRINWRASARRQAVYVNEAHPERNSDVVLFLDSFAEARLGSEGTLDLAVRAATSLAREYLERRDRVGLVAFGGIVRWLSPSTGSRQLYRIVDTLLETDVALSYASKGIDLLPPRSLPPQSLVVALTPLLDERTAFALLDLRGRGFDLVVVDISPLPFASPPADPIEGLARRFWPLWREALRFRYERLGVGVVEWTDERPLANAIEEVRAFRRYGRRVTG